MQSIFKKLCLSLFILCSIGLVNSSAQISFSNVTTSSFYVTCTPAGGTSRIIVVRQSGSTRKAPVNGTNYAASSVYGTVNMGLNNYVVYDGTGGAVTVTGLSAATTYIVDVYDYYTLFGSETYSFGYDESSRITLQTQPTTAASGITISNITPNSITATWTNGNGNRRLVSLVPSSANSVLPADGTTYSASTLFGFGSYLGSSSYVVYNSTGTSVTVSNLSAATQYCFAVFEYNLTSSGSENYLTSSYTTKNFYTQASEPTTVSSGLVFSPVEDNNLTINWQTNGNGAYRIVTCKAATTNTALPVDFTAYFANSAFGSGTQLGTTGAFVVYNGTGNNVNVTGLTANTTYAFSVFEYNGTSTTTYNYFTTSYLTGTQLTKRTEPNVESSNITFSGISTNSLTVNWTSGGGANRILAVKPGRTQTALSFDGTNDYGSIPHNSSLNTRPLTVSTWVKTSQGSGTYVGLVNKYVIGSYDGWQIYMDNGYVYGWYFTGSTITNWIWPTGNQSGGYIADGKWHHIAFTVDNSGGKMYVDGVLRSTTPWSGTPANCSTTQPLSLGNCPGGTYLNGKLDEVQVWNAALSQGQIQANMNKTLLGNESNLVGYWKLDEGFATSSTIANSSLNSGLNGTLSGFASTAAATGFINTSGWIYSGAVNAPLDLTNYAPNSTFMTGQEIGNGYYVVYDGSGSSASVNGLTPGTYYNFALFEYNGTSGSGTQNYQTNQYGTKDQQTTAAMVPVITSLSAYSGKVGTLITINGSNFSTTATQNIVYFGAVKAMVVSATANQAVVIVPNGATYSPVTISINSLTAYAHKSFEITSQCSGNIDASSLLVPASNLAIDAFNYENAIGDIDGDGKPDIVAAAYSTNEISIYRNISSSGGIAFSSKVDISSSGSPYGVSLADFDGDGKLDIAVANLNGTSISLYRNKSSIGSISFAARTDLLTLSSPVYVEAADIDKDGKIDIITGHLLSDSISIYRNTASVGYIEFASRKSYYVGITSATPQKIAIGDLDLDAGKMPDIALALYAANKVVVFKNNSSSGTISLAAPISYTTTGNSVKGIAIGDLDADSKPELVVTTNSVVSVFKNATTTGVINAGSFTPRTDFAVAAGLNPDDIALTDINGDGGSKTDIIIGYSNSSATKISILKNNGLGINFASAIDYSTGTAQSPRYLSVGDLNADNKPDIIASSSGTTIEIFTNNINALSGEPITPSSSINFSVVTPTVIAINWTAPGGNRIVVARLQSTPIQLPFDAISYTSNNVFGMGTDLGGGNYVVYDGTGNSVTITGLQSNTPYNFSVYEYNESGCATYNYLTTSYLSGNQTTLNVAPALTVIPNPSSICQNSGGQTINLAGISSGSAMETQTLVVTAVSNNTGLIPNPKITYTSPNTTAVLTYTPVGGASGKATISVTINDGATNNNTLVRTFTVVVDATPTTATVGATQSICADQTNLTGNTAVVGTGAWSIVSTNSGGINITTPGNPGSIVTGFNAIGDTAKLKWTISNGACPVSSANLIVKRISCPTTANLTTDNNTTQCINASPTVIFKDASAASGGNSVVSWNWNFGAGANPATATGKGPHTVTYSTSGLKDIILDVTDNLGATDNETKDDFINILPLPDPTTSIVSTTATVCQGQTGVDYSTTGNINNTNSYAWTLPSGANITSGNGTQHIIVTFSNSATSGVVTVAGVNACGTGPVASYTVIVNPLPEPAGVISGSFTVCEGVTGVSYSIPSIANATTYTWTVTGGANISGNGTSAITIDYNAGSTSGSIMVTGNNACGIGTSSSAAIIVNPLPNAAGPVSGLNMINVCPVDTGVIYSVGFINNATGYSWSIPGGTITSGSNTNAISVNYDLNITPGNITVNGTNACGSGASSTLPISVNVLPSVNICMVTVDSASSFNNIIWEKPVTTAIDSFRIYREIPGPGFRHIASVPYDSLSMFVDTVTIIAPLANPNVTAFRYRIGIVDTCGNVWNISNPHKTMHLSANLGINVINLLWTPYDEGNTVNMYRILRDTLGIGTGTLVPIDSLAHVPGQALYQFTDVAPAQLPLSIANSSYRIETVWNIACNPTRAANVTTSRSNLKGSISIPSSVSDLLKENNISVYPNPSNGLINLHISSPIYASSITVKIYDLLGQIAYEKSISKRKNQITEVIDITGKAKGAYTLSVEDGNSRIYKKLILD